MPKNFKIVMKPGAMSKLRNEPGVVADLEQRAERIANAAGAGHEVKLSVPLPAERRLGPRHRARVAVLVVASSYSARFAEAAHRALTRALDAGR